MSTNEFAREDRYIVIKRKDLDGIADHLRHDVLYAVRDAGLPDRQYVVIESDWPEYEAVWHMIEARVTGQQAEGAQGEREDWSAFDNGVDWSCFPGYLIDHCEGDTITEEGLQYALSAMLKDDDYLRIQSEKARAALAQPSLPVISGTDLDHLDEQINKHDPSGQSWISNEDGARLISAVRTLQLRHGLLNAQPSPAPELDNVRWKAVADEQKTVIERIQQERDAAQARVAQLERECCDLRNRLALANLKESARQEREEDAPVAQAGQVPEEMRFEYRHPNGERHTVTVSRQQVIDEMPDFLFEALCGKFCNCAPVGETNVVECCCDEYAEEFQLLAAAPAQGGE